MSWLGSRKLPQFDKTWPPSAAGFAWLTSNATVALDWVIYVAAFIVIAFVACWLSGANFVPSSG